MRTAPRLRPLTIAALLTVGVLTACGTDDGVSADDPTPLADVSDVPSTTATTTPADEPAPVASYRAWLDALAAQDAEAACARHAPDLTIALRYEAILLDRASLGDPCVDFVAVLWEQPEREYEPLGIEVTQLTDEDAFLAVDFPDVDQTVRMVVNRTRWVVEESVPRTDDSPGSPTPSDAGVSNPERWLAAWCDLALDMDPAELTALMGEPSGTYTISNGGEPQLYWARDQYDFRAYLDTDPPAGRAIDLVGDYDRLSEAERAGLTCPELR
ncbi:hypothetical protein [Nocardioides sp.]|uniref:hypothetical protein n=1 Tax=Nocardioides sp. TaxID=35761 RepID=UPI002B271406|nr:hypothetical protein [Nocardioides sp.]